MGLSLASNLILFLLMNKIAKIEQTVPVGERASVTDLNQVRVFAEVARLASITAAANVLGMPKSSVSRDVNRLEHGLGTTLFSRDGRRLVLTEAGATFAEYAQRFLAGIDEAADAVAATSTIASGVLTVQATYWLGHALLVPLVTTFMERFPRVDLVLDMKDFSNLSTHNWDVQITAGTLADSSHISRRLTEMTLRLYASDDYVRRRGVPNSIAELGQHQVVDKHWANDTSPWREVAWENQATIRPRLVVNDMIAIAHAVRRGAGIGWLPTFLAEQTAEQRPLIHVLPHLAPTAIPIYAIFQRRREISPKVRVFVDFCAVSLRPAGTDEGC